jgi:hypothetical protein
MTGKSTDRPSPVDPTQQVNPWGSSLDKLKEWDPQAGDLLLRLGTNPWNSGVLPRKGALKAGATPEEIMTVLHICVSMGLQACAKGVPILTEELERK